MEITKLKKQTFKFCLQFKMLYFFKYIVFVQFQKMFPLALKCVLFCCMKLVVLGYDQHPENNKQHFQGYIKLLNIEEEERGFIQIVLKHASAKNTQNDEKLSFLPNAPLRVCLAHATHQLIWMYDQCLRFDNTNEKVGKLISFFVCWFVSELFHFKES